MTRSGGSASGDALLNRLREVNCWRRGDQRAPHKPLLVLYALSRVSRGEPRLVPYSEAAPPLERLLREFGPSRKVVHPEYPFWRLERDGIWDVRWPPPLQTRERRRGDPSHRQMVEEGVSAGFPEEMQRALEGNPSLIQTAAEMILAEHFPETLHEEILTELGFSVAGDREWTTRVRRDPQFRDRILLAYGHRCAICGFDLRMDGAPLGLDAAHIRSKQFGGPDEGSNGLALCTLHHRLFDRGSFTVTEDRRTLVSPRLWTRRAARFSSKRSFIG